MIYGYADCGAITASIPYYGCRAYLRRAVESLLTQTHRNLTVVVVNDGDSQPPWDNLRDIDDPRLIRFSLRRNHGPYFASAVVLNATRTSYFLLQDADDWSSPDRAAHLLARLHRDGSDFAVSAQSVWNRNGRRLGLVWSQRTTAAGDSQCLRISTLITPQYRNRAPHHGLFRVAAVRRVGGYYGGFRISYDTLITNLIMMTGRVSHVPKALYHRTIRPESLTQARATGHGSPARLHANLQLDKIYKACFRSYTEYQAGKIDSSRLCDSIRVSVARMVSRADARELATEAARLQEVLSRSGRL